MVVASLLHPAVYAQEGPASGAEPAPQLQASPMLRENIPPDQRSQLPTFVEGDRVQGQVDLLTTVEGNAQLRRGDTVIRAKKLDYNQGTDLARATGDVHINKAGNIFEGPYLELYVDAFTGFFNEPTYHFLRNDAYGQASRVDFVDENHAVIHNATYTTCHRLPGPSWMPDWILRAASIAMNQENQTGQAKDAVLSFKGVPILPVPSMSFPLSDERKSGLLPPTIGIDSTSGLETTIPYYWNIAPNRDATIYPTLMTRRGVDFGGEFRYLESGYSGFIRGDFLPHDHIAGVNRWGFAMQHTQPALVLPVIGSSSLNVNLNRVSDDNYWKDLSHSSASLTQRLLSNDVTLGWNWSTVNFSARTLTWQTLQDPLSPIVPPYDRSPEFSARQTRANLWGGLETYWEADTTHFESSPSLTLQPNAQRSYFLGQISRPWQAPGWFFTPKLQVNTRHYTFDAPLASGATSADVTVPTASLDGGLIFERDTSIFGHAFRQTLEPRAFYVYTPFRDQNYLPNYDSALNDFNFATIYTENAFGGYDRISDNNLLTLGVTSRLLNPDTGAEAAKFGVAQRVRFRDQLVTLPGGMAVSERLSDMLFGASVSALPKWNIDSIIQYNPKTSQSINSTIGVRYNPSSYHVVSAAYRLQRGVSEDVDIGWQWPLNDLWGDKGQNLGPGLGEGAGRWYSVGRIDFSLFDKRLVESLVGLEYDGGCWIGRVVLEKMSTSTTSSNKRILFQLEFVGFTHLGSNALQTLKDNIPRYQFLRERTTTPSRFSNYD